MFLKPSYLLPLMLASAVLSCSREAVEPVKAEVVFAVPEDTRSASVSETVSSLDVLVFRADGSLDCASRASSGTVSVKVTSGVPLDWYLVANAPEGAFSSVADRDSFLAATWDFSSFDGGFVMQGHGSGTFTSGGAVTVELDRLMSKVTVESITPRFLGSMFQGSAVTLDRVYLINVNGSCPYSCIPAEGTLWYNRMQTETLASHLSPLLVTDVGEAVTGPSKIVRTYDFYCCPNPVANGRHSNLYPDWSPRNTRLVIEMSIDGQKNYYPITLPAMSCNVHYVVREAVLNGPGSDSPDKPVSRDVLAFSIAVNPWGTDTEKRLDF